MVASSPPNPLWPRALCCRKLLGRYGILFLALASPLLRSPLPLLRLPPTTKTRYEYVVQRRRAEPHSRTAAARAASVTKGGAVGGGFLLRRRFNERLLVDRRCCCCCCCCTRRRLLVLRAIAAVQWGQHMHHLSKRAAVHLCFCSIMLNRPPIEAIEAFAFSHRFLLTADSGPFLLLTTGRPQA